MQWSAHPRAGWYLGGLSFAESSFFPIPPDVMLMPMVLARPERGWTLALITTVASVLGGLAGYAIGYFAIDWVTPLLHEAGYWDGFMRAQNWFERWGFWAVLLAGFSPIPYKVFTIAAGALIMFLPGFILASALGRGARFFLVASLVRWGGAATMARIQKHLDLIGWSVVVAAAAAYLVLRH